MTPTYGILGPLEALRDGQQLALGSPKQRAVLAMLLTHAGEVVPASRLIDGLWEVEPPETAGNVLQGYVSGLRKVLGKDAISTIGSGYALNVAHDAFDLHRFERLAGDGTEALAAGKSEEAAARLREAIALWRGRALSDLSNEPFSLPVIGRLEELRIAAQERYLEAELACGRHVAALVELEELVQAHPLRERLRELQMLALYRSGRQAEALQAYRDGRATFVGELGIEPGRALQQLEAQILQQDPALELAAPQFAAPTLAPRLRALLVAAIELESLEALAAVAGSLSPRAGHELLLAHTVSSAAQLGQAAKVLNECRESLLARGVPARAAAFTSLTPGVDLVRLAAEHDVDLILIDAPDRLLEDARLVTLLTQAASDVAVLVPGLQGLGPVVVPFSGAEHDWASVELGAWLATGLGTGLRLTGATTGTDGRDASRLLASASLAVQRALGVPAEPQLVEPTPEALVEACADAAIVVVGLTERWRSEGLGRARTALATSGRHPTVLVRRGLRPGGLAPGDGATRFTWTLLPGA